MRTVILLGWLLGSLASAEMLAVVANERFPLQSLNEHQIKQIYLKHTRYINGIELFAVNLSAHDPLRHRFEAHLMKMSAPQLKQHWIKAHYQGKRPPIVQHSVESMLAFLREVDGALAYIPASKIPGDLKTLYKVDP